MQISGHKNVAFINNYSTLSEERHKKISKILSNTETNRNDLVPVQFAANLPRKTSTNSTASSTSDVSCRSNPNVSSYCANTNMSSEISSMFYGFYGFSVAVGRQSAIYTENSGFASPALGRHISTFRGYRILFSIRNPYINRFTNHCSIHS